MGNQDDQHKPKKAPPSGGIGLFATYFLAWLFLLYVAKRVHSWWSSKRVAGKRSKWFGANPERDAYEAALGALSADTSNDPSDEKEAEERLRKLLLRRAMTDFRRILQLNTEKESLFNLMRSGAVSEDMWNEFKEAENEMQIEIFDLQAEAETFRKGIQIFTLFR
jgi:translocation protein SEC66